MYSENELQDAVAAGALSEAAADALRAHVAKMRSGPLVDEEHFRLLTGFNDIFVSIAIIILMVALGWLGNSIRLGADLGRPSVGAGLLIAAASWPLAEYFTRQRRMALPSILLLGGFVGGVACALMALAMMLAPDAGNSLAMLLVASVGLGAAGAAWLHWRRFMVPITVAAGSACAAATLGALIMAAAPESDMLFRLLLLGAGLTLFSFAMYWDMSDRGRTTRRSDVAFWLHLTAAPLIAHSLFQMLGVFDSGDMGAGRAVMVLLLYVAFGLVALAIDRRALLVSSLAYVLFALYALFQKAGAVELSAAFTALVIGSALLLLSALWHHARAMVGACLPATLNDRLPYLERPAV